MFVPLFISQLTLGDSNFRSNTKRPKDKRNKKKRKRGVNDNEVERCNDDKLRVSYRQFCTAREPRSTRANPVKPRLCGDDLTLLKEHLNSYEKCGGGKCEICGANCYYKCGICKKRTCFKKDNSMTSISCSIDFHNDYHYGLACCDRMDIFGELKKDFKQPSTLAIKKNRAHIQALKNQKAVHDTRAN